MFFYAFQSPETNLIFRCTCCCLIRWLNEQRVTTSGPLTPIKWLIITLLNNSKLWTIVRSYNILTILEVTHTPTIKCVIISIKGRLLSKYAIELAKFAAIQLVIIQVFNSNSYPVILSINLHFLILWEKLTWRTED